MLKRSFSVGRNRSSVGYLSSMFLKETAPKNLEAQLAKRLALKSEPLLSHPDATIVFEHLNFYKAKIPFPLLTELVDDPAAQIESGTVMALFRAIGVHKIDLRDENLLNKFVSALTPHIKREIKHLELKDLYSLRNLDSSSPHVRRLLSVITPQVRLINSPPTSQQVYLALSGLQKCKSEHIAVAHLLIALTACLLKFARAGGKLLGVSLSRALFCFGHLKSKHREVQQLVGAMCSLVSSTDSFGPVSVGNSLYGFRNLSSDQAEVRQLIAAITPLVAGCKRLLVTTEQAFTPQQIANSLFGIRLMDSSFSEVRQLVAALVPLVSSCTSNFSAQELSNCLYGLQNMSSEHSEVCMLIEVIIVIVSNFSGSLSGQGIGNALYGLRKMSSHKVEVRRLLRALTPHIITSKAQLNQQEVGNALYGLQNCSSDSQEVRDLVSALIPKVAQSGELSSQAIGNSLFGLRYMSNNDLVVNQLLAVLAPKISACKQQFRSLELGSAIFGLNKMNSESDSVRAILAALFPHIISCKDPFNSVSINNCIFGLSSMNIAHTEVRQVLSALIPHAELAAATPENDTDVYIMYQNSNQRFGFGLLHLSRLAECAETIALRNILTKCTCQIEHLFTYFQNLSIIKRNSVCFF